jgi:hypothetical protein
MPPHLLPLSSLFSDVPSFFYPPPQFLRERHASFDPARAAQSLYSIYFRTPSSGLVPSLSEGETGEL